MLKEAIGVVLPKPGKDIYQECLSFQVIALMQTFLKRVERIVNKRLMKIAYESNMYCINQTESLPQSCTVNAVLSLRHWTREAQFTGKKVSMIFLDVKEGFDNVDHHKLNERLERNTDSLLYLVDWIRKFIAVREIGLAYLGSRRTLRKVDKGILQGSLLPPLLFVMYVRGTSIGRLT